MPDGTTGGVVAVRCRTSRVLFAPETFNFAEVTRAIEVARRMPSHVECVFAGFSRRNSEYIKAAGFEFHLLTPYLSEEEGKLALDFDQGRSLHHPFTAQMLAQRVTSERVPPGWKPPPSHLRRSNPALRTAAWPPRGRKPHPWPTVPNTK